jgi:tRNA(Met) C34 N-acetyltransferase TmcA
MDITNRQWTWDSRWICKDNSDDIKDSFIINGIYELLIEKHFRTGINDYRIMADALPNLIRSYRERC